MDAVAAIPNHDALVAEPPPVWRVAMPLIFVGGVAYAWYLWNQASQGAHVRLDDWFLPAIAILCGPLWFFNGSRRVVMSRVRIAEYRAGKLLRQYPVRAITALRPEINGFRVVLSDGRMIGIPNMWIGANEIRHHVQTVVDVRNSDPAPMDDWLPLNYLTFPPRCVSCGSGQVVAHRIFAGTNYTLPNMHVTRGWQVSVPACSSCSQRRKVMGVVTAIALYAGGIGLILAAIWGSEHVPELRVGSIDSFGVLFLPALLMFFVIVHVSRNQVPRWLDQKLLGIAALRLGKDRTTVRLWFRDRQEEIQVRTLTAENRSREMASTAGMLRSTEHA